MYNCDYSCDGKFCRPRRHPRAKHCSSRQRGLIIRRPTRTFNFDVQLRHGPIAYHRTYSRVGPMERLIDLEDGFEKATKVADIRRVRRARERSRARRLAV